MIDTDKYEGHTVRDMTFSQAGERLWFLEHPNSHNASDCMTMNKETLDLIKKGAEDEVSTVFKNVVDDAFSYAMISDTQQMDTTKGTLFGAYNAVTGYYQNVRNYKNDEAKLQSIVLGGTAQLKSQKAFDLCNAFALDGADILNLN